MEHRVLLIYHRLNDVISTATLVKLLFHYYATVLSSNTAYDKLLLNPRLSHLKHTQDKLVKACSFSVFPGELADLFYFGNLAMASSKTRAKLKTYIRKLIQNLSLNVR